MEDQSSPRPAQDGTTGEHLCAQGRRFAVDGQAGGALKLAEQIEQQQHGLEGSFGGEELLQTETVGSQVVLEFGDAVFHVGAPVVVAPDFFWGIAAASNEKTKGIAGHVQQFATHTVAAFAHPFAHHHEAPFAFPAQ